MTWRGKQTGTWTQTQTCFAMNPHGAVVPVALYGWPMAYLRHKSQWYYAFIAPLPDESNDMPI
jgi:hypothetical protein